jgi:hypothetical protein
LAGPKLPIPFLHPAERQINGKASHDGDGTTLRAIRLRCLDCSGGNPPEVAERSERKNLVFSTTTGENPSAPITPSVEGKREIRPNMLQMRPFY